MLEVLLLGGITIKKDGRPVDGLVSRKAGALVAYLVCTGQTHSREALGDMFWDDRSQTKALGNLRVILTSLRQQLGEYVNISRQTVTFNTQSNHWLDVAELFELMESLPNEATDSEQLPRATVVQLKQVVNLYRGDFLAGFNLRDAHGFEEWVRFERERLRQFVTQALHRLVSFYLGSGEYQTGLNYAAQLTELDSFSEEAHQQMMLLLVRTGQRNAALRQYETCRRILADELGVEPMEETTLLYRRIKSISTVGAHNLPPQNTAFVGRTAELMLVGSYLTQPDIRLVTLVGPGGIGKTRLGVQVALENRTVFLNGVCFVPLAAIQSPDFLLSAIIDALQISLTNSEQPKNQLLDYLRNRELLLFLDNFEHLVDGGSDLVNDILQAALEVKLLITTRERLHIQGERVFEVGGLPIPPSQGSAAATHSAVQLFLQSANSTRAGFTPNAEDLAQIARICRLVEGMPLAIELAAAWVHVLSCREIAQEIERNLGALSAPTRNIPQRHRSLRAVCDYSWALLSKDEQLIFQKFGAFVGQFDREAAQRVTGVSLLTLSALVDKSLVRISSTNQYDIHELLRQYAAKKLAEDPAELENTLDRHAGYYAALLNRRQSEFENGHQQEALKSIESAIDNMLAGWQWSLIRGRYQDLRMALDGLFLFYQTGGRLWEGAKLFERAVVVLELQQPTSETSHHDELSGLVGSLLLQQARLLHRLAAYQLAEQILHRSLDLLQPLDRKSDVALALEQLGWLLHIVGRYNEAQEQLQASLETWSTLGDRRGMARVKNRLGHLALVLKEYEQAETLFQEALTMHRKVSSTEGMAVSLNNLGHLFYELAQLDQAHEKYYQSLSLFEQIGDSLGIVYSAHNLGAIALIKQDYEAAESFLHKALYQSTQLQLINLTMQLLDRFSLLFKNQGNYERAYALAAFVTDSPRHILPHPSFIFDQTCLEPADVRDCTSHRLLELQPLLSSKDISVAKKRYQGWEWGEVAAELIHLQPNSSQTLDVPD